jgi:hypothetical protein
MKKFNEYINEVKEPTGDLKKACWTGYTAVGTKKKNGKTVPNCVPEEVVKEGHGPWGKMTQDKLDKIAKAKKREEKEKGVLRKPGSTLRKDTTNYVAKVNKLSEEELEENHIAIAMGKEMDDEGSMIMNQLDHMERSINMMRGVVKDPNMQIPAWVQSKVTLAADYIETAAGYMSSKNEEVDLEETAAWQRKEGKRESGGLNQKGVDSYRRENPGSKLKTAVTTEPSKLKAGSAAANRRKSFCARMSGMKKRLTSAATAKDPDSRINKSLRKWNC